VGPPEGDGRREIVGEMGEMREVDRNKGKGG